MEWLRFISDAVSALAWPVSAVVILVLLREPLKVLLPRIESTKVAGVVEATFAQKVDEVSSSLPSLDSFTAALVRSAGAPDGAPPENEKSDGAFDTDDHRLLWVTTKAIEDADDLVRDRLRDARELVAAAPGAAVLHAYASLFSAISTSVSLSVIQTNGDVTRAVPDFSEMVAYSLELGVLDADSARVFGALHELAAQVKGGLQPDSGSAGRYIFAVTVQMQMLTASEIVSGNVAKYYESYEMLAHDNRDENASG